MTNTASFLPGLPNTNTNMRKVSDVVNQLVRWFNRTDLFVPSYAADSGSGTAYVTSPSTDVKVYEVGQEFDFKATNANTTTAPTLNVQGLGAGTITVAGGGVVPVGAIAANGFYKVIVTSTTPTFQLLSPAAAFSSVGATTFLGVDVALNNATAFFSGPNTGSIGAAGQTWLLIATGAYFSTSQDAFEQQIFDGTNALAADLMHNFGANGRVTITNTKVVVLAAATTFTLRAKDQSSINGTLATTGGAGTANIATSITAVRLA